MLAVLRSAGAALGWRLPAQVACIVAGLLALGGARPGTTMLMVPLTATARTALPALALDGDSSLVGAGILPGSLLVRLTDAAAPVRLTGGVLSIRVPAQGCAPGRAA